MRSRVWLSRNNSCQNVRRKMTSQSDKIDQCIPLNLTTSLQKTEATDFAVKGCVRRKWLYLLNLSTTAKIVSKPPDLGRPTTKSKDISSQTRVGIGSGCRRPAGARDSYLFCWQTKQVCTYRFTSCFIWGQKNSKRHA